MKKIYYSIGDVSKLVNEEKYILRYWESEFAELCPKKNSAGNRSYTQEDLDVIRSIQELLRKQQMALKDAKQILPTIMAQQPSLNEVHETEIFPEVLALSDVAVGTSIAEIPHPEMSGERKTQIITLLKEIKHFLQT